MTYAHGYSGYSTGCRCETCRAAKAEYMRQRRAAAGELARALTSGRAGELDSRRFVADVREHGSRYAYEERGCRCGACTRGKAASRAEERRRARHRPGGTADAFETRAAIAGGA